MNDIWTLIYRQLSDKEKRKYFSFDLGLSTQVSAPHIKKGVGTGSWSLSQIPGAGYGNRNWARLGTRTMTVRDRGDSRVERLSENKKLMAMGHNRGDKVKG